MKILTILLLLFLSFNNFAQDTIRKYYDAHWHEVQKNDLYYYRIAVKNKDNTWSAKDYYKNGNIQMIGKYKADSLKIRFGRFVYFYKNGIKKNYGIFKNNRRDGVWKWHREDGSVASVEHYKNGKFKFAEFYNKKGRKKIIKDSSLVFKHAFFPGGQKGLLNFLSKNIRYPKEAKENNITGRVFISFTINTKGGVDNIYMARGVDATLDKEAIRVIKSMPKWKPGRFHNMICDINYTVPINFTLR